MNKPLVPRVFETLVLLIRPVVPSACFPMSRKELCEPLLPHMNAHGEKTGSTEYETKALKSLERRDIHHLFSIGEASIAEKGWPQTWLSPSGGGTFFCRLPLQLWEGTHDGQQWRGVFIIGWEPGGRTAGVANWSKCVG